MCATIVFPRASLQTGVYHLAVFDCIFNKPVKDWKIKATSLKTGARERLGNKRHHPPPRRTSALRLQPEIMIVYSIPSED